MELFQLITREGISLGQIIFTTLSKFEMRNTVYLPNRLKRGRAVLRNTHTHSTHSQHPNSADCKPFLIGWDIIKAR